MVMISLSLRSALLSTTFPTDYKLQVQLQMKKLELTVPECIKYLSEWKNMWDLLPLNEHIILDKQICGCGATEMYINSGKKVILSAPRKHLLFNKYSQHLEDDFHLFRFMGDKKKYFEGKTTPEEMITVKSNLADYIYKGGKVILTPYDSLGYVFEQLKQCGENIDEWIVVVDEFQVMFNDCQFKPVTEYELYRTLQNFRSVVYLSATPYLEKYLDMSCQFKDLTICTLQWPETMIEVPKIEVVHTAKSVVSLCEDIIQNYRTGNGRSIMLENGETFISREAVFYINSVKEIIRVIRKMQLQPDEVTIICSATPENNNKLRALSNDMNQKYTISEIPGRGDTHKMFTFCTSTVYVGADFYSKSAYSYIFANPKVKSMAIDVSVDLQQIVGRQRLATNPFRNSATLYFNTKVPQKTDAEFEAEIEAKNKNTISQIENFNAVPNKELQLDLLSKEIEKFGHLEHFCCITKDCNNNDIVVKNEMVEISERRSRELLSCVYNNDFSMYKAISRSADITKACDSSDNDIQRLFNEWSKDNNFSRKMELYCEMRENVLDMLVKCNFIERKYHEYYKAFGREGLEALQWRENNIKQILQPMPFDVLPKDRIAAELIKSLQPQKEYSKAHIKELLADIYKNLGIDGNPSASDIEQYMTVKSSSTRKEGKKTATFKIESPYRTKISLFSKMTDVKNPQLYDIDTILEIIRTGKYFHLEEKIERARKTTSKEDYDKVKSQLPAVTWNGTFKAKCCSELEHYSSFVALDFDHIPQDEKEDFLAWIKGFPCVYAYFLTPSGCGYKVIILHDNYEPRYHYDLYDQLLKLFDSPWIDRSTSDIARGHYLSYDPTLEIIPNPQPFHFIPSTPEPKDIEVRTETIILDSDGSDQLVQDDDYISNFMNQLQRCIISDEEIIRILRSIWTGEAITRGRNNAAMSYAGVLCKAGIKKGAAKSFIEQLIPGFDVSEIIEYAYKHNIFGCERRKFRRKL